MSKNKKNKKFNKNMNPTEKNQPQDEEVLKNQEAAEAAIDEETQKEATEELNAEEKVNKELAEAQKTIEEQHDKYLRLSAEFDNYRKRTMKEKAELIKNGGEKAITAILPILDDLERAVKTSETSDDVKAMREGIELIYNKFLKVLNQEGLQKIETDGENFGNVPESSRKRVPQRFSRERMASKSTASCLLGNSCLTQDPLSFKPLYSFFSSSPIWE